MKKIIYAALLLVSTSVLADGAYDGIWASPAGYFSVHENGGTVIVVRLASDRSEWEASMGQLNGSTARLESIISSVKFVIDVTFDSDTTYTATLVSCIPVEEGSFCAFPDGTTFPGTKIW